MWAFFMFSQPNTAQGALSPMVVLQCTRIFYCIRIEFLEMIYLCCIFVLLIEKDGGIRPCEVLATCAYKVLHSTGAAYSPRER
jgi:hypothetical protein